MAILMPESKNFDVPFCPEYSDYFRVGKSDYFKFEGWQSCREVIQKQFLHYSLGLWYSCDPPRLEGIVDFMSWVEQVLILQEHSKFYRSSHPSLGSNITCLWIEPFPFWMKEDMRRNLFTLFLRVGLAYAGQTKKNIRDALLAYEYSRETMPAIDRFLLGFTKYVGPTFSLPYSNAGHIKYGWHSCFQSRDSDHVCRFLKRPDYIKGD